MGSTEPSRAGNSSRRNTGRSNAGRSINALVVGLAAAILIVVAFLAGWHYFGGTSPPFAGNGEQTRQSTGAAIGGPFTLVDHNGNTVTEADFGGSYMLIYFGYTYCPDICPTSLSRNSEALKLLGDKAGSVVPIMISVDPERDSVEHLKDYVDFFHPRMVALTGTPEQVADAAKAYRVYYAKVQEDKAEPDVYLMDHTSITYLMGPDGSYVRHFGHGTSAEEMASKLEELL